MQDFQSTTTSTDWLSLAAQTAHVAMAISSHPGGRFIEVNEAFCRLFQYSRADIIGRSSAELGLWPDPHQRERLLQAIQRQGSVSGFEARYRNRLGEMGDLQISARLVPHGDDTLLIGFLSEVTGQHEMLSGLRTAQIRLGVMLRSSKVLVFCQDARLRYTWVANPALGVTEEDLLGRTDDEIMGATAAAPLVAIKRHVLDSGRPLRRDVWVANNGQLGCFDLVVEPERDPAGRVSGIVCAAFDITERMTAPNGAAHQGHANRIKGLASLLGREPLSPRQSRRLAGIDLEAASLASPTPASAALTLLSRHHAGSRVVLAEHNPVLRELATALLEDAGLQVVRAATGVEAFSLCMQLAPALLLLDMELPQRGAVAATHALRAMLQRRLPIVAMVTESPPDGDALALDADLDDLIEKPVVAEQLYAKVLVWLETR
jgi:PAS domain S-box-containing protein